MNFGSLFSGAASGAATGSAFGPWGAAIGGGIGLAGSLIGNKQQSDAAARAGRLAGPHSVSGDFGSSSIDANGNMSFKLDPMSQQWADMAHKLGLGALGQYNADPMQSVPGEVRSAYDSADSTMATSGSNASANAGNLFSMLQHLGSNPTEIGNNYYNILSKQAQPGEERAFNGLQSKLFAQGRLGTSGGGIDMQGLFDSQAQADLGRQAAGAQFGQQWFNNLQSAFGTANNDATGIAANRYNLATNLLNVGNTQNNLAIQQGQGFQDLYSSMFNPLMNFQKLAMGGNDMGAAIGANSAKSTGDMYAGMFGQLSGMFKNGGGGSPEELGTANATSRGIVFS